jgi:hypothetical protein
MFEDIGKAMLVSILDIFEKNPCSRIGNTQFGNIETLRRELAKETSKINRFKRDITVGRKCKKINELAKEIFYDEFTKKNCFERGKQSSSVAAVDRGRGDGGMRNLSQQPAPKKGVNDSLSLPSSSDPEDDFNSSDEERSQSRSPDKIRGEKNKKTPAPPGGYPGFRPLNTFYGRVTPNTLEKEFEMRRESV